MTKTRRIRRLARQTFGQTWFRALLYTLCIPLFPEYLAPVLAMLAFGAACKSARAENRTVTAGAVGKVLMLYIGYLTLTLPFAEMPLQSFESLMLWYLMFFAYLTLTTVLTDRHRLDDALYLLSLVTGVVGLIGCVQYFLRFVGLHTPLQLWEPLDRAVYGLFSSNIDIHVNGVRVSSTFNNPNIVGQYLVMVTPFVAYYAFHGARQNRRTLCRFCLLAVIGCAAFTFSRGTYLALLMVALVLAIANIRNIVTILLSLLSAVLLVPDSVWNRLISVGKLDASGLERLSVWEHCLGLIGRDPLFGSGCGVQYTWSVMLANGIKAPHAHNIILQVLIEGGLVGLCLMLFLGFRVVHSAFSLTARRESRAIGATIVAFVVGFCTNGMVEYGFTFPKLIGTFALVLAVTDAVCSIQLGRALSPVQQTLLAPARLLQRVGHSSKA